MATGVVEGGTVTGGTVVGGVVTVITGGLVVAVVVVVVVVSFVVEVVTTGGGAVVPCVLSGAVLTVPASTGRGLRGTFARPGTLVDGAGEGTIVAGEPFGAVVVVVVVVGGGAGSGIVVGLVALWLGGPGVLPW